MAVFHVAEKAIEKMMATCSPYGHQVGEDALQEIKDLLTPPSR